MNMFFDKFRKIFFVILCLSFAGCAAKSVSIQQEIKPSLPTLNNLSRGELNLACSDADYLVKLFLSEKGVIFKYTAMKIAYPQMMASIEKKDQEDISVYDDVNGEYKNFIDSILAPFRNNKDDYAKVLGTVVNSDVRNVFNASFLYYLGLMDKSKLTEYVKVTFCGEKKTNNFMSPDDVDANQLQNAILDKLNRLKKDIQK